MTRQTARHATRRIIILILLALSAPPARADVPGMTIALRNHEFVPAVIEVPAGVAIALHIVNEDTLPEKFRSHEMDRELVVPGNSVGTLVIGPLRRGVYMFFGEYHAKTAQGKIFAR
ncbi:MAG: cupredoxin domain-containing protein [Alphaproteobacteria bacterium]|nr:cupredoxin domain-containing protein [Alphaproteobacteria bacterium]